MIPQMKNQFSYPFKSHFLNIDGVRYHYIDEGDAHLQPILLLHGNPTWGFFYRNLINDLRSKYRVIVPDHVGMGLSDKPHSYPYRLENHIHNVKMLVETLNIPSLHLVVHDWGGLVGMGYAVDNNEKIQRMVILNTAAFYLPKLPFYLKVLRNTIVGNILVLWLNLFLLGTLKWGVINPASISEETKAGYLHPYQTIKERIGILKFLQDIPFESNHPSRSVLVNIDNNLHKLKDHPTLVLWGNKDPVFKEKDFLSEWKNRFPSAQVHSYNAGHLVLEEVYPQVLEKILSFLS